MLNVRRILRWMILSLALGVVAVPAYSTQFSTADYNVYVGDFNGDGRPDLLYIAKRPDEPSGIALADTNGVPQTGFQSWASDYLNIPWSSGAYTVIVGDFNGDTCSDILLQSVTPGTSYVLLANCNPANGPVGQIQGISQAIAPGTLGLTWSADQHHIIAGDFDGDGKTDLFLQATSPSGTDAIVLADSSGNLFTRTSSNCWAGGPQQCWTDGYLGFKWSTKGSSVYAGYFDADHKSDLLIVEQPTWVTIDFDVAFPVPTFLPQGNAILLAQPIDGSGTIFRSVNQQWSTKGTNALGANWSPLATNVIVGNFSGSGSGADVLLQSKNGSASNMLLIGSSTGQLQTASTPAGNLASWSANGYQLLAGEFGNGSSPGLYVRPTSDSSADFYTGNITGGTVTTYSADTQAPSAMPVTSVGKTRGAFAVSAAGSATYTIPLWTPPGVHGVQPSLALVYNSSAGDGFISPGWSLAGLSSIARCNATWKQDGTPTAVTLTTADRYCMDGRRLRITSSGGLASYGQAGTTYQTDIANFANVIASSTTTGSGPSYFTAQGQDGLYYEYGNPTDPQGQATNAQAFALGNTTTPYAWYLDKVSDRQGNYLIIHYTPSTGSQGTGTALPSAIWYTYTSSNSGNTGYEVAFTYNNYSTSGTSPPQAGYVNGASTEQPNVLAQIAVTSGAATVRAYYLTYTQSPTTGRGLFTSLQECAGSGGTDCLSPTQIAYQPGTIGVSNPATSTGLTTSAQTYAVDVNGDGRTDLVYSSGGHWWVSLSTGTGYGTPIDTGITNPSTYPMLVDDFLGNGKTDILAPNSGTWYLYQLSGNSIVPSSTGIPVDFSVAGPNSYAVADLNGDGLPDLVWADSDGWLYTRVNTATNGVLTFSGTATQAFHYSGMTTTPAIYGANSYSNTNVHHMDFNGDGREDIVMTLGPYAIVPLGASGSITAPVLTGTSSGAPAGFGFPINWNDDQCTDLAVTNTSGATAIYTAPCNGQGGGVAATMATGLITAGVDWDGDGRTDVVVRTPSGQSIVYLSSGVGIKATLPQTMTASGFVVLDIDGDGLDDLLAISGSGTLQLGLHNGAGTPPDLATSFTDGFGVTSSPTYVSIARGNYTEGNSGGYPDADWAGPLNVVSQVVQSDGTGGTFTQALAYWGAQMNLQGLGFDGFARLQVWDSRDQTYRNRYFSQTYPATGLMLKDQWLQPDNTTPIAVTVNTPNSSTWTLSSSANNQQYFPNVYQATTSSYEVAGAKRGALVTQTVTTNTYDGYGNLNNQTIATTDEDSGSPWVNSVWQTIRTASVTPNTSTWCISLPTQTTEQRILPDGSSSTRTTGYGVDYTNCRDYQQTDEPGNSTLQVLQGYSFDACGNVSEIDVTGQNPDGTAMAVRKTKFNYSYSTTRCQFPELVTNANNEQTVFGFNYSLGVPTSKTDPNGIPVNWGYDNFGRKASESRADGTSISWQFLACNSANGFCGTSDLRFYVAQSLNATAGNGTISWSNQYFDGLGRARYTQSLNLAGGSTYTAVVDYDQFGRKQYQFVPYSTGADDYFGYSYDVLGRVTSDALYLASGSLNRQTTYQYSGRTVTMTDPKGAVWTRYLNVLGQLGRATDPAPGGTSNYVYEPFGALTTATDPGGNVQSWTHDIRGNLTQTSNPDQGTWQYGRDSLGEMLSQTDAKANKVTFLYDPLGRPYSRTEPEGTSGWTWGSSAALHNIDRLQQVSGPGYSESYNYDNYGRRTTTTYSADTSYQLTLAYSPTTGLPDNLTYPASTGTSPLRIQYGYQNGILNRISDYNTPSTVYWQMTAQNARGAATSESLGNGVVIASSYDDLTGHLNSRTSGTASPYSNLQNLSYQFDNNENLTDRIDGNQNGLDEHFSYDALNRLSTSTLNGTQNFQVVLDASGNIVSRSDVGSYTYDPVHVHGVKSTSNGWSFAYDANGNMTSDRGATVQWTSYNLPSSITNGSISSSFAYTPDRHSWQQVAQYASGPETTIYIGGLFEKVTGAASTDYRHYIKAGDAVVIVDRSTGSNSNVYYVSTDHLGSSTSVTNSAGVSVVNQSFAAYGARRGSNWTGTPSSADLTSIAATTRNGYTGHTMLDNLNLIHMNGRVQDPLIGRFLSPDPSVPGLDAQNLNRYAYAANNPLAFVDPSGFDDQGADTGDGANTSEFPFTFVNAQPEEVVVTGTQPPVEQIPITNAPDATIPNSALSPPDLGIYMTGPPLPLWAPLPPGLGISASLAAAFTHGLSPSPTRSTWSRIGPWVKPVLLGAAMTVVTFVLPEGPGEAFDAAMGPAFVADVAAAEGGEIAAEGGALALLEGPTAGTVESWSGSLTAGTVPEGGMTAFRIWGGESSQVGSWLSPIAPESASAARSLLALPAENTAEFISTVQIPAGTMIQFGRAASAFGEMGGGMQIQLLERIPISSFGPGVPLPP